ncbi:uncharacterized protein LOC111072697 [Drosophila obscura]|uniref:uncharacterized protein LOC111072697 n=1 Tax=Drosophila obscura TaxID=7282 RepID=UPI000BA0BBDC|nr:uncharacterized protein LOC111072697 [Drosophila obscura]
MCESCKNYSDEKCVKFFAIWNMVWGAFFTFACGGAVYEMHTGEKQTIVTQIFTYCGVVCAPIYLLSGILIYFGDKRDSQGMFKLGLYLSNPLPVVLFTTIFMPIVHFIALMRLCKYYRERWE